MSNIIFFKFLETKYTYNGCNYLDLIEKFEKSDFSPILIFSLLSLFLENRVNSQAPKPPDDMLTFCCISYLSNVYELNISLLMYSCPWWVQVARGAAF